MMNIYLVSILFLIPFLAQMILSITLDKNKEVTLKAKKDNIDIVDELIKKHNLDTYVVSSRKVLYADYDYKRNVLRISNNLYNNNSLKAICISVYEIAKAILKQEKDKRLKIKETIKPLFSILLILAYILIIIGIFAKNLRIISLSLGLIGIYIIYALITLKIESKIKDVAQDNLKQLNFLNPNELKEIDKILNVLTLNELGEVFTLIFKLMGRFF